MSVQHCPTARPDGRPDEGARRATDGPQGWVHVHRRFLDKRTTHRKPNGEPITRSEIDLWELLEGYAGVDKPICWPSVGTLADALGCKTRWVLLILKEMETDGIIRRVFGARGKLIGYILLKRLNPTLPEPKEADIPALEARLRAQRMQSSGRRRTVPFEPGDRAFQQRSDRAQHCAVDRAQHCALEPESLSLEPEQREPEFAREDSQRQRPEAPSQSPPDHPAPAPDVPTAAAVQAPPVALDLAELPDAAPVEDLAPVEVIAAPPAAVEAPVEASAPPVALDLVELHGAAPVEASAPAELPDAAPVARPSPARPTLGFIAALASTLGLPSGRQAGASRPPVPTAGEATRPRLFTPVEAPPAVPCPPVEPSPLRTVMAPIAATPSGPELLELPELVEVKAEPPPVLTLGQEQWLATLDAEQRGAFDALPPERRAYLLGPHRLGFCSIAAKEFANRLRAKVTDAPAPSMPATIDELWEKLPGAPPGWRHHAAEALVREFNTPKDRELYRAFEDLADRCWRGEKLPSGETIVSAVLDALRQSRNPACKSRGAVFKTALDRHGVTWGGSRP